MKARYLLFMLFILASVLKLRANDANWDYNPYAFQYDMTVYVALSSVDDKSITEASGYEIAAFCDEECRGIAEEKTVGEHKYAYLRVRSNKVDGETINFKVRNVATGKIAKVVETIEFKSQQTIGYPSTPFAINALNPYSVTFVIDGVEHRSNLFFGDAINVPTETNKEGYTFVGWSPEVEETVPDHDVTYTAIYSINQYTITFDTDGGSEVAPITQDYNTAVTAPADPTKTGYTFTGWDQEIPATMPAENLTIKALWTINSYKLTYKVDGEVYKQYDVEYNAAITPEAAPEKEGHTFSGWSEIPEFMPANDVEVTGTFTVNQYKVTFISDGVVVKEETLDFGTAITAPEDPTKVGHTFTGWAPAVDATVPSHDVTYTAQWTVNTYKLTYYVDGEVYKECDVDYGTEITPEECPTKEGYNFSGWSEIPETMPDHDVIVTGTFTQISTSINSMLVGSDENRIFDMSGRKLYKAKKGLNIINGKKVFVE